MSSNATARIPAQVIKATLALVGSHIDEISTEFYETMFGGHPELLRNLFNRGNQAQGAQQRALAASIATFAAHLVDPDLPHPSDLLSRIGHKHASLGIAPEQYQIVHDNLFAAIVVVLGADTVTPEVAAAWDRVYWIGRLAGQYVSVGSSMADGARQLRQYSLVNAPGADGLTFAVKPVPGIGDAPAGRSPLDTGQRPGGRLARRHAPFRGSARPDRGR